MRRQRSKIIFHRAMMCSAAALLLVFQMTAAAICFAEDVTYESVRDETLFITIPQSWQIEEFGSLDGDEEIMNESEEAYKVLELQSQDGEQQGQLWIWANPYNDSYFYCSSKEDAADYLETAGNDAIDAVLNAAFPDADSTSWSGEEYLKGEDASTYVIRQNAQVDNKKYVVYLSCDFTLQGGVNEVLFFAEPCDQKVCDSIGESLEAYSYATELIDNRIHGDEDPGSDGYPDYYYDNESGIGLEQFFSAITVVFLVMLILGIIRRGMHVRPRGKPARSVMGSTSSKSLDNGLPEKKQDGRKVRRTIDKWTLKEERKGACKHEDMHIQTGTKYSGYFESLKTLHGSGLLTTKEMNELLEKHKDDI